MRCEGVHRAAVAVLVGVADPSTSDRARTETRIHGFCAVASTPVGVLAVARQVPNLNASIRSTVALGRVLA